MKELLLFTLFAGITSQAQAASTSAYTDLTDSCETLTSSENDPNAEIDYFTSVCPGREGYDVRFDGGDLRSWISLAVKGTGNIVAENISFASQAGQFINVIGSKLEWRYTDGKLTSLIVRMSGQDPDDYTRELETLAVVRIDKNDISKSCVVGVVDAKQSDANAKARVIADGTSEKCLEFEEQ